jgi:hypothetical protein
MLTIAGEAPSPVIFDTGINGINISARIADKLHLRVVGSIKMLDAATGIESTLPEVLLPNSAVSGIPLGDVRASTTAGEDPDSIGVLGPYIFSGRLVTLEFGLGRLRLSDPSTTPDGAAYPFEENLPTVPITVAGVAMNSHFDSGNNSSIILPKRWMTKLPLLESPYVVGSATSSLGTQSIYQARLRGDLRVGPLVLHNPKVAFGGGAHANVGLPILRQLTFAVDPKRQLSWLLDPKIDRLPTRSYAGRYGQFVVAARGASLAVRRGNELPNTFVPIGSGLFEDREDGTRVQFRREGNRSTGLLRISPGGGIIAADRTS